MAKIIKNTTGNDLLHIGTGINFPANSSLTLDPLTCLSLADSQTQSLLNGGSFVYNNGTSDLNASDAWAQISANWYQPN